MKQLHCEVGDNDKTRWFHCRTRRTIYTAVGTLPVIVLVTAVVLAIIARSDDAHNNSVGRLPVQDPIKSKHKSPD